MSEVDPTVIMEQSSIKEKSAYAVRHFARVNDAGSIVVTTRLTDGTEVEEVFSSEESVKISTEVLRIHHEGIDRLNAEEEKALLGAELNLSGKTVWVDDSELKHSPTDVACKQCGQSSGNLCRHGLRIVKHHYHRDRAIKSGALLDKLA
jgi:hypothetical protein